MEGIVNDFLESILSSGAKRMDGLHLTTTFAQQILKFEDYIGEAIKNGAFTSLFNLMYATMLILLSLKVIEKGFNIYILYRDGDADTPPKEMLLSIALAISAVALFPIIYDYISEFIMWLITESSKLMFIRAEEKMSLGKLVVNFLLKTSPGGNTSIIETIGLLVFLVYVLVFWFQVVRRSVEMFILRMVFPLSCIGLVDSDGGMFKASTKLIIQNMMTIIVQYLCFNLSLILLEKHQLLFAFGAIQAAINGPALMQSLLANTGGSGANMGYKAQQAINISQTISHIVRR